MMNPDSHAVRRNSALLLTLLFVLGCREGSCGTTNRCGGDPEPDDDDDIVTSDSSTGDTDHSGTSTSDTGATSETSGTGTDG